MITVHSSCCSTIAFWKFETNSWQALPRWNYCTTYLPSYNIFIIIINIILRFINFFFFITFATCILYLCIDLHSYVE